MKVIPRRLAIATVVSVAAVLGLAGAAGTAGAGSTLGQATVVATGGVTTGFSADQRPSALVTGADGLIWFATNTGLVARRNADGTVTEFTGATSTFITSMVNGPDGNIWFTEFNPPGLIGRITPSGVITEFAADGNVEDLAVGPDGNLWVTQPFSASGGQILRVATDGTVTPFTVPVVAPAESQPRGIAAGSDGNLWFTDSADNGSIWKLSTSGDFTQVAISGTTPGFTATSPGPVTAGPDGALWFVAAGAVGRITTAGEVTEVADASMGYMVDITSACGSLWAAQAIEDSSVAGVWRITTSGSATLYTTGLEGSPSAIDPGPGDDVWVTESMDPGYLATVGTGDLCGAPVTPTSAVAPADAAAVTPAFTG